MPDDPTPLPETPPQAVRFFDGAIPRMQRFVLIAGGIFSAIAGWRFGWQSALGFAAGAVVSYFSFRWLHNAVQSLAGRIVDSHRPERGFSLVAGFFTRYLLVGAVAYVIFTSSSQAFRGFLFGLCTPVAALLTEAGFEAYSSLRRGH